MQAHQITLQRKMKKLKGHMFVGENALYFICSTSGSAWWDAVGQGVGGLAGGVVQGIAAMRETEVEAMSEAVTEDQLRQAVSENPESILFVPENIETIKHTMWTRTIKANGERFGVPRGWPKELRRELGPWTKRHNVLAKGML